MHTYAQCVSAWLLHYRPVVLVMLKTTVYRPIANATSIIIYVTGFMKREFPPLSYAGAFS